MIEIKLDSKNIEKVLSSFVGQVTDLSPVMRKVADTMEKDVIDNFEEEGRPKWLGIKYRQGQVLNDTHHLKESIDTYSDNQSAIVGTNEPYAAIHQFGGMAGRGKKVKIPARPFLKLTEQDEMDIMDDIQDYFRNILK